MKYSVVAVSALATAVAAKPQFLNSNFDVQQGQPFELKFDGCSDGCTIVLQNGESTDLKDVKTLATGVTDGSIEVSLDGLPSDSYAFKITDAAGESNYSEQFEYEGTGVASTTAAASTSASASVSSAASTEETTSSPATAKETTTSATSTPASAKSTANATLSTTSKSSSATSSEEATSAVSTIPTASATTVSNSGAKRMTSSLALIAGAVAAMVYLN